MSARQLVLENQMGQRVRTFAIEGDEMSLIYRFDTRRVEGHTDLTGLEESRIEYKVLKTVRASEISEKGLSITGLGRLRLASPQDQFSPTYELVEEDDHVIMVPFLQKSAIGHAAAIVLLVAAAFIFGRQQTQPEPQLVTVIPQHQEVPQEKVQTLKVSEKKIIPQKAHLKVANKTVLKPHPLFKEHAVVKTKSVVMNKKAAVVHGQKMQRLDNVGALAVLGGLKNGTKGYQGLDANSLKNIRSAGVGSGGGGVGANGAGGMRGVLPGTGLIAGSSGSGGRAEGAGGYGTRGVGGGRAGYGHISLVGNTSGITLPVDDEASVEGGLDRDQIAAVINKNKGQIIYCYEQGLQAQPSLSGRVSVQFVIGGHGRITTAKVAQTSLRSAQVEGCMLAKMRTWQFPHPVGNVNVDVLYPFELRRVSSR